MFWLLRNDVFWLETDAKYANVRHTKHAIPFYDSKRAIFYICIIHLF